MKFLLLAATMFVTAFAGCLTDSEDDALVIDPDAVVAPTVDAVALLTELQMFAETYSQRADNLPAHEGARDWMEEQFLAAGLDVWRHEFENGIAQVNVAGIKWGEVRDEWVIVGAHYDMVTTDCAAGNIAGGMTGQDIDTCLTRPYSQGAYDDGSGTLMTVHLAQAFAEIDTYYTIAFVAFDGEERGLQGSGAFAQAILDGAVDPVEGGQIEVRGMLNLDMFGLNWPGVDAPIYFDSNSQPLRDVVEAKRLDMGMPDDMIKYQGISLGRSDYAHFMDMGAPTGFFISDFEEWQLPADIPVTTPPAGRSAYPFWHVEDTYDTMLLMAGSQEDLESGFQAGVDLASEVIAQFAMRPDLAFPVEA